MNFSAKTLNELDKLGVKVNVRSSNRFSDSNVSSTKTIENTTNQEVSLSKSTTNKLDQLGVKVNIRNSRRFSSRKVSKTNATEKQEVVKTIGDYKVIEVSNKFRDLENENLILGALFQDDTFDLIGENYIYIEGELYREAKIITSWLPALQNKIGWLCVNETTAPKEAPVKKLLSGRFRVLSQNLNVLDCKDLKVVGSLTEGDSIDFDEFNESITLEDRILRKVIVRDSNNHDLINKKVWMPILFHKKQNNKGTSIENYKVIKNTKLFNNLESLRGVQIFKGDLFKFTDEPMQFIDGFIFKKVEIISSVDTSLQNKIAWIDLRATNALTTNIQLVEEEYKKVDTSLTKENLSYKEIVLNSDILGYTPNCNITTNSTTTILQKGTKIRVFEIRDINNRRYVELEEKGADNISKIVQYTIN